MQLLRTRAWIIAVAALGAMGCAQTSPVDPPDSGAAAREAGAEPDAGLTAPDAGTVEPDAGTAPDAGVASDAGTAPDAGATVDAGAAADGGAPATDGGAAADAGGAPDATLRLPPANAGFDYQLGGSYPPPAGVRVLARDRTAQPVLGLYNICYVNGFQIQPGEVAFWETNHPELMLRDGGGNLVVDTEWNEVLLDVSTPSKRAAIAAVIATWIEGCARAGYDAVDIDNLDSFSRSQGLLTVDHDVAAMRLYADEAHARGLAISQKNAPEIAGRRAEMATDFAVAEECNRYSECGDYTAAYGDQVFIIEYRRADFDSGCAAYPNLSIILRDLDLVTPADRGYLYQGC